ncbi:response regulator [Parerythrobacter lacustris]|uniref:Response regulator n=1 Tax=Parerythrobacter lacustris TaxID=2969984 RepID=A0ABT1XTW9_9SPHN|nr:response regulator [Parerythrobacter lacustris]MCR2835088.1 response regulator [Parerythrobacter lacustris]
MQALIIEDEYLIALAIEDALIELGYTTFAFADTVAGAIEAAGNRCPDLIVADHRISDGTGTDAVKAICSGKPIPVVFMTGSGEEVLEELPGAVIVLKPFSLPLLEAAIKRAIEHPVQHTAVR